MAQHVIRPIPLCRTSNAIPTHFTYLVAPEQPESHAVYVWYIEGPTERMVVDAGSVAAGLPTQGYRARFPHAIFEHVQSLEEGLSRVGLKPEDIDIVILTHLHIDHVGLAHKYTKAKFIIQKAELDFAYKPHPVAAWGYTFPFQDLNFEVVEGDREVADGVKVILTPGHSAGTQSVLVQTSKGDAVITGPCCVRRNFEPPPLLGVPVIPPGIHLDLIQAYDSMLKLKDMADIIIPNHDLSFMERDRIP